MTSRQMAEQDALLDTMETRKRVSTLQAERNDSRWWQLRFRWQVGGLLAEAERELRDSREHLYKVLYTPGRDWEFPIPEAGEMSYADGLGSDHVEMSTGRGTETRRPGGLPSSLSGASAATRAMYLD